MDKLIKAIEKHLIPIATKLNGQRHLAALRDGFIAIMPLMIIGAFAVMINSVFLDFSETSLIGSFLKNPMSPDEYPAIVNFLKDVMDFVSKGSLSVIGILAAGTIAYSLTRTKGYEGLEAAVISLAAYFITFEYVDGTINSNFFGTANLITAIIIAFFVGEVYTYCLKKNFRIKMPEGVPPAVERSFSALIPATLILIFISIVQSVLVNFNVTPVFLTTGELSWSTGTISLFIQNVIGLPLHVIGGGLFGIMFYAIFAPFLWFFGIHGPNTLAFLDQAIFTPAAINNADLINQGIISYGGILNQTVVDGLSITAQPSMYTKTMLDGFIMLGGAGTTLGLVIAIIIASRDKAAKKVAKYSLAPALFNINEPLLFGLPIVFNPILFIPFIIIQPILIILTVIVINIGFVPMFSIPIPWTSPVGIGAFLGYGGSISAMIWAFVCLGISVVVYYPFVVAMNRAKTGGQENEK